MKFSNLKTLWGIGVCLVVLTGCGGIGGDSSSTSNKTSNTTSNPTKTASKPKNYKVGSGIYLDAPVEGVGYECGEVDGVTDSDGIFVYEINKSCIFKIGALTLRRVDSSKLDKDGVIIQETNPKIAQLLLSLNRSKTPDKIKIDKALAKELQDKKYKKSIDEVDIKKLLQEAQKSLEAKGIKVEPVKVTDEKEATIHLRRSYQEHSKEEGFRLADNKDEIFNSKNPQMQEESNMGEEIAMQNEPLDSSSRKNSLNSKKGLGKKDNSKRETIAIKDDENGNLTQKEENQEEVKSVPKSYVNDYSYIPTKNELTDEMAVKFLNMATFGATPKLVAELKSKGVVKWVEDQLNMPYNEKQESVLRRLIKILTTINPTYYSRDNVSVDDWIKDNNGYYFNQGKRGGPNELFHNYAEIFNAHMSYKDQLRQRVAYALSQIIVVSQSNDLFFTEKGEALAYYYDILQKRAFGKYKDLLYDISLSPSMATFLTFAGNRKEYTDPSTGAKILPDENYGREIMQLFTIGLYELNMDGTQKRTEGGKKLPTYTQEDVNNLSRVFTGLSYAHARFGESILKGDNTHPLTCFMEYHDTEEKKVLGETLPAGQSCEQDVKSAVDLLMRHPNVAPFVAKKLIMRLTKSNPKPDYVRRVAEAFANSNGDLKETVKAVLLDPEIWENIKNNDGVKIKEPYLAYTQTLRALNAKPLPYMKWVNKEKQRIKLKNNEFVSDSLYSSLGQWPTNSPTVFNFYDDEFVPDNYEFKIRGFVAPELEIITAKYKVAFNNTLQDILLYNALPVRVNDTGKTPADDPYLYKSHNVSLYFDYKDVIDVFKKNGFGENLDRGNDPKTKEKVATAVIDYLSKILLGKKLPDQKREILISKYKNSRWFDRGSHSIEYMEKTLVLFWIKNMVLDIVHTDEFMVQ